jgi:dephospho-CoA kinase
MSCVKKNHNQFWFLTGNVGTGKSTILDFFLEDKNFYGFKCDDIAKDIIKKENIKVDSSIFDCFQEKQKIENIIHPKVWEKIEKEMAEHCHKIFIIEAALIFEIGWNTKNSQKIIVTTCSSKNQKKRLFKQRNYSDKKISQILKNQLNSELKEEKAKIIINTDCSLKELKQKIDRAKQYMRNPIEQKLLI